MYSTLNQMYTYNIEYFCKMTFESVMWSLNLNFYQTVTRRKLNHALWVPVARP